MPHRLGQHEGLGLLRRHRAPRRPRGVAALDQQFQQRVGRRDPPLDLLTVADDDGLAPFDRALPRNRLRSEEHTSELQSLMRISYAVFCLKKKTVSTTNNT